MRNVSHMCHNKGREEGFIQPYVMKQIPFKTGEQWRKKTVCFSKVLWVFMTITGKFSTKATTHTNIQWFSSGLLKVGREKRRVPASVLKEVFGVR